VLQSRELLRKAYVRHLDNPYNYFARGVFAYKGRNGAYQFAFS